MTIDISLIAIILNFILLMIVLNTILYKPLKKYFEERQNKIQNDIDEASKSLEKANKLVAENESKLKNAIEEARCIKEAIHQEAIEQAENIIKIAKKQEHDIILQTENKLVSMNKQAMKDLESQLTDIVIDLAGKVLTEKMDDKKDKELINRLLVERGKQ